MEAVGRTGDDRVFVRRYPRCVGNDTVCVSDSTILIVVSKQQVNNYTISYQSP